MEDSRDTAAMAAFTVEELEEGMEEANRVLGVDDPNKCTYDLGYRPRQAVFSCLTCAKNQPAGVCVACALVCHDSHELVELWTRRSFRCDCGNSKFGGSKCQLQPHKEPLNSKNQYNHNYNGVYCICHRPYPAPERQADSEEEVMTQCVVCEDWFHDEHLGQCTDSLDFEELICPGCFEGRCQFLAFYSNILKDAAAVDKRAGISNSMAEGESNIGAEASQEEKQGSSVHVVPADVCTVTTSDVDASVKESLFECKIAAELKGKSVAEAVLQLTSADLHATAESLRIACTAPQLGDSPSEAPGTTEEMKAGIDVSSKAGEPGPATDETAAELSRDSKGAEAAKVAGAEVLAGGKSSDVGLFTESEVAKVPPVFLLGGWRTELCTCPKCLRYYADQGLDFLKDESDTVRAYEESSKQKVEELEAEAEKELNKKLEKIGHVGHMNILYAFEELKETFASHLEKFKGQDHVITAEHVQSIFAELKQKRLRTA